MARQLSTDYRRSMISRDTDAAAHAAQVAALRRLETLLEPFHGGGSERQRRDVAGILETIGEQIDAAYIEQWVRDLVLEDEWRVVRSTAST